MIQNYRIGLYYTPSAILTIRLDELYLPPGESWKTAAPFTNKLEKRSVRNGGKTFPKKLSLLLSG